MEYLVIFLPFILLLTPKRGFLKKSSYSSDVIKLIEGRESEPPKYESDLYKVAKLLLEVRKVYGAKALDSLMLLKQEAFKQDREARRIKSVLYGAYFQQGVMLSLVVSMILITNTMFTGSVVTYSIIGGLQIIGLVVLKLLNYTLERRYIHGGVIRLRNLLVIRTLSQSGLSVGRVLKNVDWKSIEDSSSKRLEKWDQRFLYCLSNWQSSGSGLHDSLAELDEELAFIRTFGEKKFHDYMNGAKFVALVISGFLSYFVYLFSFVNRLLT